MSFIENIIKKVQQDRIAIGDFSIDNISIVQNPFEFEHYIFSLSLNGETFGNILLSKRLVIAFAQNLLKEKNILILPDFIEASSIILLTDILNFVEDKYGLHLEISSSSNRDLEQATDLMIAIRYKNIVSPVLLQISAQQIFQLAYSRNIQIEDETEFDMTFKSEQYIPANIIGRLSIDDKIRLPSELGVYINSQIYLNNIIIFKEEDMEREIQEVSEIRLPVVFQIRLGGMTFNKIKELLTSNNLLDHLNNRECRIILGNSVIANGEVNENKVRITKIFI